MKLPFKFGKKRDDDEDDDEDGEDFDLDSDASGQADDDAESSEIDEDMLAGGDASDAEAADDDDVEAADDDDAEAPDDDDEESQDDGDADGVAAAEDLDAVAAEIFGEAAMEGEDGDAGDDFPDLGDDDSDDVDFDDEDDDEDGEGTGRDWFTGKRRLIVIASAAGVLVLSLVGAGTWWFLAEPDDGVDDGGAGRVAMALPPKSSTKKGLTPPKGRSLNTIGSAGVADDKPPPESAADDSAPGAEGSAEPAADDAATDDAEAAAGGAGKAPVSLNAIGATAGVPTKDEAAAISAKAAVASGGLMVAAVTPASFSRLPVVAAGKPLAKVPDPALVEETPNGPLPKLGDDGRTALQAYARPFDRSKRRPRLAVIIAGLGLSRAATEAAITRLPGAVTLAFDPYASGLDEWLALAREAGHEVLLSVPLEPDDFPVHDPGPYALLTSLDPPENLRRLDFLMARLAGYVGVLFDLGSRFTAEDKHVRPILMAIKGRGVMLVDNRASKASQTMAVAAELGLPRTRLDVVLDRVPSRTSIDAKLASFEDLGRKRSRAVALGRAYPSTLERLAAWAATLGGKKMVLAPISAMADKSSKAAKPKAPMPEAGKPKAPDPAKAAAKTE